MRANTVLAGSKLKLERFVMLLWNFTERGKTYQQISNAANLPPQAHYVEDKLSPNSIAKWNKYFRYLCKEDYLKNRTKVGGKNRIVEIDETMCGKLKYGKGDPTKRRGAWVFGGIERGEGGRAFMSVCPNNQRTKDALWPIIEENIAKESAIYSDGLATYRKLHEIGYTHRWAYNVKVKSSISK